MALDTLLEKPLSACETATVEELDKFVWDICYTNKSDTGRLARCVSRCEPDQVSFAKLRHLRIFGDLDKYYLEEFEQNGISRGFYLNADATWLLLFLPEHSNPANYLSRCGNAVESLSIRNTPMPSLDAGTLTGLKRLELEDNPLLERVEGVSVLTVLEQLTINDCPELRDLPGLKKLRNLTELSLSGCSSLTKLSGLSAELTHLHLYWCTSLTSLDLSGCRSLVELDLYECSCLTTLDLSECSGLTSLDLPEFDCLTTLDLSECSGLTSLDLSGCEGLTKLVLSKCQKLTELVLPECDVLSKPFGLPAQLTHLNLSGCESLTELDLFGYTGLIALDLSGCEGLTRLELFGCNSLATLNLSRFDKLTELDLSHCKSLVNLDLSQCRNLTKLVLPEYDNRTTVLSQPAQLTHLNLSGCTGLTNLDLFGYTSLMALDLSGCESLTRLDLWDCDCLTELHGLETLTQLTDLELSGDEILANLCGLENYTQLTELRGLERFTQLTLLSITQCNSLTALCQLPTSLTSLYLAECESLTKLDLSGCNNLTSLDLSGCDNLTKLDLSRCNDLISLNLSACENLTELDLSGCDCLTSLDLSECENLTSLNLSGCSSIMELDLSGCENLTELYGLETLTRLTTLSLSQCGGLATLDLSGCESLTELDLSGCRSLAELKGLENLTRLTDLTLPEYSALTALPDGIRRLPSLRRLDLRYMHLTELPDWLPEIAEQFALDFNWSRGTAKAVVLLKGTKVDGVDMSIFDQPYEMVVKWFEARKAGRTQPLNEIKVIFLGDGEAGKSYTISRLMNNGGDPVGYEDARTAGIAIKNHPCQFNGREFTVNYWDFGGQQIMHSMHRVFLTNRTMYVVLINAADPNPTERARYWLRNIKSFAPDAPVLLVLNKIDVAPHVSMKLRTLQAENSNLIQLVRLSALEFDQQKFNSEFRNVLLQAIINTKMLDAAWPKSWIDVKTRMENLGQYYIPLEDYEEICADCQVEDVQAELLDWFNDLGISFCCRDNFRLENQVILNPRWITNGLYIILFNHCEGAKNGMVPHRSIHNLLKRAPKDTSIKCTDRKAAYKIPGDAEYVLGIMRQFGLSLQIGNDLEFIPMLCQEHPTLDVDQLGQDENVLEFHMAFEYLPDNVLHRLMVERYGELDKDHVWKSGARFEPPGTGLSAVVAMDGDTLKFYISHTDLLHAPKTYLTTLKAHVARILQKMNLRAWTEQLVYKADGKRGVFDYEALKHNFANNIRKVYSSVWKRDIVIADILDPFAQRPETEEAGTQRSPAPANTDADALLAAIRRSCQTIQDEPIYRLLPGINSKDMEDLRNRRVRDDLGKEGYNVTDQSQRGSGKTGKGAGEVDLMVRDSNNEPWTIIEALRVANGTKAPWNIHLDKLIVKYNTRGYPVLYLLTYVDADPLAFSRIMTAYQKHTKTYGPKKFTCCKCEILDRTDSSKPQYTRVMKCQYKCGDYTPTVYHIFARIPTPDE